MCISVNCKPNHFPLKRTDERAKFKNEPLVLKVHAMWFSDGQRNFREIFIALTDDILAIVRVPLYGIIKITLRSGMADIFIKSPIKVFYLRIICA